MHEASLVSNLIHQVEELAKQHPTETVAEVKVEIGLLSGVEPFLLLEAFDRLKQNSLAKDATLHIDDVGLTMSCQACDSEFHTTALEFVCPKCRGSDVIVTRGDSVTLVTITLETKETDSH